MGEHRGLRNVASSALRCGSLDSASVFVGDPTWGQSKCETLLKMLKHDLLGDCGTPNMPEHRNMR